MSHMNDPRRRRRPKKEVEQHIKNWTYLRDHNGADNIAIYNQCQSLIDALNEELQTILQEEENT